MEQTLMEELAQPVLGVFPELAKKSQRPLWFKKRLLILGTGQLARDLSKALQVQRRFLVDIVGYLDGKGEDSLESIGNPTIIGTYDQLTQVVEQRQIDTLSLIHI